MDPLRLGLKAQGVLKPRGGGTKWAPQGAKECKELVDGQMVGDVGEGAVDQGVERVCPCAAGPHGPTHG